MSGPAASPPLSPAGVRKAAILLLNLDYQQSDQLLRRLSDDQVEAIGRHVADLGEISQEEAEAVIREFLSRSGFTAGTIRGGWSRARKLLTSAFGDDAGNKMSAAIPIEGGQPQGPLAALETADPSVLTDLLGGESSQTIAVVLAHVSSECSSGVLQHLGDDQRNEVALRMSALDGISPKLVERITGILAKKLAGLDVEKSELPGGPQIVADLLNRVSPQVAEQILSNMDEKDGELAGKVRDLLFVFEDLKNVDADGIRELVKRIDRKALTVAIKGVSEDLVDFLCETMSKRGAEMLREDMEALGPVKIKDVEAAQKEILQVAREMETEGVLSLSAAESDEYVQ